MPEMVEPDPERDLLEAAEALLSSRAAAVLRCEQIRDSQANMLPDLKQAERRAQRLRDSIATELGVSVEPEPDPAP